MPQPYWDLLYPAQLAQWVTVSRVHWRCGLQRPRPTASLRWLRFTAEGCFGHAVQHQTMPQEAIENFNPRSRHGATSTKAKTTLNIDERLMARVKQEAARQGRTMSEFIESALRLALQNRPGKPSLTALPTFSGGPFRVNIADDDALQDFHGGTINPRKAKIEGAGLGGRLACRARVPAIGPGTPKSVRLSAKGPIRLLLFWSAGARDPARPKVLH
jgi:predicted DNA binding CopG/RHH family protein